MPLDRPNLIRNSSVPENFEDNAGFIALESVINYGQISEGSTLPPPQIGQFRVPVPSGFIVLSSEFNFAGNIFVLSWQDVQEADVFVARYNIYAKNFLNSNSEPTFVGSATRAPFSARVIASEESTIVFYLQPVLQNGISLPLESCPTCTGVVPDAIFVFEADDDAQGGETARVEISDQAPLAGGTTVGLWISYPYSSSPLNTYYTTIGGGGMQLYSGDATNIAGV